MGPHGFHFSSDHLVAGQAATLTADLEGTTVVGTPQFSWDLDGDRVCETEWSPNPSVAITLPATGNHWFSSCAKDDDGKGAWTCSSLETVWPSAPQPTFKLTLPKSATRKSFRAAGLKVRVTWDSPVRATFRAAYNRASGPMLNADTRALAATTVQTGPNTQVLRLAAPAAGSNAARFTRQIGFTADLSTDPVFGPVFPVMGSFPPQWSGFVTLPIKAAKPRR